MRRTYKKWWHESSMSISNLSNPICSWSSCSHTNHIGFGCLASFFCFLKLLLGLAVLGKIQSGNFFCVFNLLFVTKFKILKTRVSKSIQTWMKYQFLITNYWYSYVLIFPWSLSTNSFILSIFLRFSSVVNCNSLICLSAFNAPLWTSPERIWVTPESNIRYNKWYLFHTDIWYPNY